MLAVAVYVVLVLVIGSVVTYLVVPQPTGSGTVARRSAWSAALGFFAAVPIAYLVMVVAVQVDPAAVRLTARTGGAEAHRFCHAAAWRLAHRY